MLENLNGLDTVVTGILEREKTANTVTDVKEENKAAWIGSYHVIERVMRTFLLKYNSVPDVGENHHLDILEAFDEETMPLHEALGVKPRPGGPSRTPAARRYIDELRRLRNAENHPAPDNLSERAVLGRIGHRIGYRAWYTTVFQGLVQCLKICIHVEKLKQYVAKSAGLFRCSAGAKCGRYFKTYAKWRLHALREHSDVFKITGTGDETSSTKAPTTRTAFDIASAYLGEVIRAATLAAKNDSDTDQVLESQQSSGQTVAQPGSTTTSATGCLSASVSNVESDASRKSTVERLSNEVTQKLTLENATQQAMKNTGRLDSGKQISEAVSPTLAAVAKVSDQGERTTKSSRAETVGSGLHRSNITSPQSALEIMVSEHQIALQRIADLELKNARLMEDLDCGEIREMSLAEEIKCGDETIIGYEEIINLQRSELQEAAKAKRERYKEGRADGERAMREKLDCRG